MREWVIQNFRVGVGVEGRHECTMDAQMHIQTGLLQRGGCMHRHSSPSPSPPPPPLPCMHIPRNTMGDALCTLNQPSTLLAPRFSLMPAALPRRHNPDHNHAHPRCSSTHRPYRLHLRPAHDAPLHGRLHAHRRECNG